MRIPTPALRRSALGIILLVPPLVTSCRDATDPLLSPSTRRGTTIYDTQPVCEPIFAIKRAMDGSSVASGIVAGQKYTIQDTRGCGISSWGTDDPSFISIATGAFVTFQAVKYDPNHISTNVWGRNASGTWYQNLTISPATLSLTDRATVSVGTSTTLYMEAREDNGTIIPSSYWPATLQFSSDNAAIATASPGSVSGNGRYINVAGLAAGATVVRTAFLGGHTAATISVTAAPAASVTLNTTQVFMIVGGTFQLSATVKDASGTVLTKPVTWSSANPSIVTVSSSGRLSAVAAGNADITATVDGVFATAHVSVDACSDCTTPSGGSGTVQ